MIHEEFMRDALILIVNGVNKGMASFGNTLFVTCFFIGKLTGEEIPKQDS